MSARNRKRDGTATDALACALAAVERGWAIVPLNPASKAPLRPWGDLANRPPDPTQVQRWFRENPGMNYGIATGAMSGVMVIDIDSSAGADTLKTYGVSEESHPSVRSGRPAGHHLYGAYPPSGMGSRVGVLDGVDVRADGAYIVGPGSRHPSGTPYLPSPGFFEAELPVFPESLLEVLSAPRRGPDVLSPPVEPARPLLIDGGGTRYGLTALWRETEKVARTPRDTRNNTLNTAALNLFRLVAGGELDEAVVQAALEGAAERCGLVADDGWGDVRATIASARRAAMSSPRCAPSRSCDSAGYAVHIACDEVRRRLQVTPDGTVSGLTHVRRRLVEAVISRCGAAGQLRVTIALDDLAKAAGCDRRTITRALADARLQRWVATVQRGGLRWDGREVALHARVVELCYLGDSGDDAPISTSQCVGRGVSATIPYSSVISSAHFRRAQVAQALAQADRPLSLVELAHLGQRTTLRGDLQALERLGAATWSAESGGTSGRPRRRWSLVEGGLVIVEHFLADEAARQDMDSARRAERAAERCADVAETLAKVNKATGDTKVRAVLDEAADGGGDLPWSALARAGRAADD